MAQVPTHCNLLWRNQAEALQAPRGDILLTYCHRCGYIYNPLFATRSLEYDQRYENSLDYSHRFQSYLNELALLLIERHNLFGKKILEIGSGQGEFLRLLCKLGDNSGTGFDPSYVEPAGGFNESPSVQFISDYYSEKYSDYPGDLICSRQTLEHIPNPGQFLIDIRRSIREQERPIVFFEVPNALFTLKELSVWDIIYEHCSYFHNISLSFLFKSCGFKVLILTETFEGQFLCVEAVPENSPVEDGLYQPKPDDLAEIELYVRQFAKNYKQKVKFWRKYLTEIMDTHQRVVIWGAGSKGVSFLNTFNIRDEIKYAVDINPRKHGMYITGTGQEIVAPDYLSTYQPEVVIVMNCIYMPEIRQTITRLGLRPKMICA